MPGFRNHHAINCCPSAEQLVTEISFVGCSPLMEPKLVVMRWFPQSVEHQRWDQLLATVSKTCIHQPKAALTSDFFNNRNETATGRRENNGVLTNETKIELGWPFRSERKWRHRKTDVGWPPCQEANILWEVSTDLTNRLNGGLLDLAILLAIFWQKSTFSRTSDRMRVRNARLTHIDVVSLRPKEGGTGKSLESLENVVVLFP